MFPVTLVGPRIELREWRLDDASAVFSYVSNPEVSAYVPWDTHSDIEETKERLSALVASAKADGRSAYGLAAVTSAPVGEGGRLVGEGRISVQDARHRRGDIGYVVNPDWWSKGLGTEIAGLLLDFGFGCLGLHRIEATAHPDNIASQRVLEKAGMSYEGRIRDHMLVDGTWRDSLSYAILETDPRPVTL
ncbi:GNAT family protein [Actinopolymorpha sp. B9G3]|uniref:GNAT family N-acetyltransferase n=1 Tax=Actinopolymorpha sp. B9G3 TaxID=3158970 RepID=UPI0032D97DF3